jgi:hypothetical protein
MTLRDWLISRVYSEIVKLGLCYEEIEQKHNEESDSEVSEKQCPETKNCTR